MEPAKQQIINCVFNKFKTKIVWIDDHWELVSNNSQPQHTLFNDIIKYIAKVTDWYHDIRSWVEQDIRFKFPNQKFTINEETNQIIIYLQSKPTDFKIYHLMDEYRPYFETSITPISESWS